MLVPIQPHISSSSAEAVTKGSHLDSVKTEASGVKDNAWRSLQ